MKPELAYLLEFLFENFSANRGDRNLQLPDELSAKKPNRIEVLLVRGLLLSEEEKYLAAIQNYTEAIEIASGIDLAHAYAGRCFNYYQLEEVQKSIDDCECALELNPNESVFWKTKGILLVFHDNSTIVPSLQAFQKGLEINPHDQKMLEYKEILIEPIKKELEKSEFFFQDTGKLLIEKIQEISKMDSDRLDQSNELMESALTTFQKHSDHIEDCFKEIPFLFLEDNKYLLMYYFIQAMNSGINAIYPSFDQEKMECCQDFFKKAKQLVKNGEDYARIDDTQILLEKGFACVKNESNKVNFINNSFKIGNVSMTVLAAGAFSLVLLISGQWFFGLIGLVITYFLWQS